MGFILNYLIIAGLAKSMGASFKFYKAALTYAVIMASVAFLFSSTHKFSAVLVYGVVKFLVALPVFYLLDRYSDTIFAWLVVFGVGATILLFL